MSQTVKILNPAGGPGYTSAKSAAKYVKRGLAHWVGGALEFSRVATDHREQSCADNIARNSYNFGIGMATLEQIAGIPCAGDPVKGIMGKRPAVRPREYPEPIIISRRYLPIQA